MDIVYLAERYTPGTGTFWIMVGSTRVAR